MRKLLWTTALILALAAPALSQINDPEALRHYQDGRALAAKGDFEGALKEYKLSIQKEPENDFAYGSTGYCYYELHRYHEAEQAYLKAIKIKPTDPFYWAELGQTYVLMGQVGKGKSALEKAYEMNPQEPTVCFNLACIYQGQGNTKKATELFETCLRNQPPADLAASARTHLDQIRNH